MASGCPTVSVVIATFNRPGSLYECLKSLEQQTVAPLEVIVVVDGELTGQVQETIDTFKAHGKLKVIQINNGERRGGGASKNRGAEAASGDIVAFVDDDIVLAPDWTAQILKGYDENEDAVAVGGRCVMSQLLFQGWLYRFSVAVRRRLFRNKMGKLSFIGMPYLALTYPRDGYMAVDFLHIGNIGVLRDAFLSTRLDESIWFRDEFDLCLRLSRNSGKKLIYNPHAVGYHLHTEVGGIGLQGHQRLQRDLHDHVIYLMKNYNLRFLRLGLFCFLVALLSLVTGRAGYLKAIRDGLRQYRSLASEENG